MARRIGIANRLRNARRFAALSLTLVGLAVASCDGDAVISQPLGMFTTFQRASVVIGQKNFKNFQANHGLIAPAVDGRSINGPQGNALLRNGQLVVPDSFNNRELIYDGLPAANNARADIAIGQPNLATAGFGTSQTGQQGSSAIAFDGDRLVIADVSNNRILIYDSLPTSSGAPADIVLQQPNFTSNASGCSQLQTNFPANAYVGGGRLFVADGGNNRVLIWNSVPTTGGVPPDLVLGQGSFTLCAANDNDQDGTPDGVPSSRTLSDPIGVWSDGTRLIVVDSGNHRILLWNTFPTSNFERADLVLGQPNFTSANLNTGPDGLTNPENISSNGEQFAVADFLNNRVLIWNELPTENGQPADVVLGQSNFFNNFSNDDNQDSASDATASDRVLNLPRAASLIGSWLIVADSFNHRFLIFEGQ